MISKKQFGPWHRRPLQMDGSNEQHPIAVQTKSPPTTARLLPHRAAKSISKAAHQMLLSQPSVSLQIKALERELGVQLFQRHGPRISLTFDGQRLLEMASPLVERDR